MPIQPALFPPLPIDTARAAEAAFGKGNVYLMIGDQMERWFAGVDWAALAAAMDKPAATLAILALVTAFQYAESLPDRRAAEAVRTRTDWKYALHLPLEGPVFDHAVLCQFRSQFWLDAVPRSAFQQILDRLAETGLFRGADDPRADALGLLAAVCLTSRLERLADAMRTTLEVLATLHPEWLRKVTRPHWYERYNRVFSPLLPRSQKEQQDLAQAIGNDAWYLLQASGGCAALSRLPEMLSLTHELQQQFTQSAGQVSLRLPACSGCDPDWRLSNGKAQPI